MNEPLSQIVKDKCDKNHACAVLKGDKAKSRFAIKLKDEGLVQANKYLRDNGLFPDDDDDDDDMVFGDDDFPS